MALKTKTVSKAKEEMNSKKLQELIIEDRIKRENDFKIYLDEGMKKFSVSLVPRITINSMENKVGIDIIAL